MNRLFSICLLAAATASAQSPQRVEVSRDLWISAYDTEREGNNGGSPKLKLKGTQEFFLIDFDPAPFRGKFVDRAELHVHLEGPEKLGRITVSSVKEPWVEGIGTGYAKVPGATSYLWLRTDEQRWRDVDVTGSTLGNGGSIWGFGDASAPSVDQWQTIPIDRRVVQARLDGSSEGFFVMDDVGCEYTRTGNTIDYRNFPNRYVASREGKKATKPYFLLWIGDQDGTVSPKSTPRPPATVPRLQAKLPDRPPTPPQDTWFAARGETIGMPLGVEASQVVACDIPGLKTKLFALPKVAGFEDPLVPIPPRGEPTPKGNAYLEIYIPKDAKPGRHEGFVSLAGGGKRPIAVNVWNFTLPDRLSFLPQMNCYGLPEGQELAYYRLAQENRTVLNCLPYGWTGKVDVPPKIAADGFWDWTKWDAAYGSLLDGSAFAGLPRGSIPIEAFYLPLNENWPMDHDAHFRGGYWVEHAYDDAYWTAFRNAAGEFAKHLQAKGWTEPMFEFYLNNKVYFKRDRQNRWDACSAAWVFDEPANTQDFWALRRFGMEFWQGVATHPGARFTFRIDVSRPQWQRNLLDGVTSVEVTSGILRTYHNRVMDRAGLFRNLVYLYGSANKIGTDNSMPAAWCVETWALGADGVVPWQTVGKAKSWSEPDELSLFYPTPDGPVPSLRLKSFLEGEQLTEYLTLYAALSGQSREAIGAVLREEFGFVAELKKRSEADAGSSLFPPGTKERLEDLRLRLGAWLHDQAPPSRERWHDPRPPVRNPADFIPIAPLTISE